MQPAGSSSGGGPGTQPLYCPSCDPTTLLGCLFEIVETLVLTLIIFLVIQTFVAQPYKVQQQSMEHTLEPDQYVLVDKLTPRFDTYKRGDIVVFTPPADWAQEDGTPFIKRVIGVGGDKVEIKDGQRVRQRDGARRAIHLRRTPGEPAATDDRPGRQRSGSCPPGELFLMGDHRANSADSRDVRDGRRSAQVIGRAWLRYWPVNTFGILPTPTHPELTPTTPMSRTP